MALLDDVKAAYDELSAKVREDLMAEYNEQRLRGSDFAKVYSQLIGGAMQLAMQMPIQEKELLIREKELEIKQKELELKDEQKKLVCEQEKLTNRQRINYDDVKQFKLLEAQANMWALIINGGMYYDDDGNTIVPDMIATKKIDGLYDLIKNTIDNPPEYESCNN